MKDVYLLLDNEAKGPYTVDQLTSMWKTGQINKSTQFAYAGGEWQPISKILHKFKPMGLFRTVFNVVFGIIFLLIILSLIISVLGK